MKKLILAVVILLILSSVGAFVYFYYFTPSARATSKANEYMSALLADNTKKAQDLYKESSLETNILVQRNYKQISTTNVDGNFYTLYQFTDEKSPAKLRITVTIPAKITKIQAGDLLGATPAEDKQQVVSQKPTESHCLSVEDLSYIDSTKIYARNIRGATMIFLPNSTQFKTDVGGDLLIERMVDFFKKAHSKDFVFELRGYMPTSASGEQKDTLANLYQRRATTLQSELVKRGIPLDRATISQEFNYYDTSSTDLENDLYVDINIVNRCRY